MDRGTQAVVVVTVVTSLAGLFIFLRIISRFVVMKSPGIEDYCIIVAMGLSIALAVIVDLQRRNGLGKHVVDVSPDQGTRLLQLLYISILVYNSSLAIVKASLLYQYLRFLVERKWRRACYITLGLVLAGSSSFLTAAACTCIPVAAFWRKDIHGTCIDTGVFWYAFSVWNLISDFACLALPLPVLLKLKLPKKQKISLIFVFTLGAL